MSEMIRKFVFRRSRRELAFMLVPLAGIFLLTVWYAFKFVNPAPPHKLVLAVGDGEGDYAIYGKKYHDLMAKEGIDLEVRPTAGSLQNIRLLTDPKSDVTVAFAHDGIVTQADIPEVFSLGAMYYEPLWIFTNKKNGNQKLDRLNQFKGKTVSLGEDGSGTKALTLRLLADAGVTDKNAKFLNLKWDQIQEALHRGQIDVAFFIGPAEDELIEQLMEDPQIRLISLENAAAMQRKLPFLHHLSLPHGSISLAKDLPATDVEMVAPTATLLAKKTMHPALIHLLLQAATTVHSDPGVFEQNNEFPAEKDYEIDLSEDARQFYKSGAPAWHRYLPFWLATLLERLLVIAVPFFAVVLPALKMIPRFFTWRARRQVLGRYAELKFIEIQMRSKAGPEKMQHFLVELRKIEHKVNHLKVPLEFAEQVYGLKANLKMVRDRIHLNEEELG